MKRTAKKIMIPLGSIALLAVALYGLGRLGLQPPGAGFGRRFADAVGAQPCWNNTLDTRIPQVDVYGAMERHMLGSREGGKTPKLLFVGYDGALASAMGAQAGKPGSAVGGLAARGGLWLAQAGGAAPGDQFTRTAPGWTSMFTGVWADRHGVYNNGDTLSPEVRTLLYQLSARGKEVSFSYSWKQHGAVTYINEAEEYPEVFRYNRDDAGTAEAMLRALNEGQDAVFGILEYTDHEGHLSGYSHRNPRYMRALEQAEADAARLIEAAQARMERYPEDWLIIIASDHGGFWLDHHGTTPMESTTFFASNQMIF